MSIPDPAGTVPARFDTSVVHPARRYNYWLGGKDHFPADRASGDVIAAVFPAVVTAVRENRRFLGRAVHFLAAERGIDQFLDIGPGLPAPGNTHDVAQAVAPHSRVVYVDNDPMVLTHARARLTNTAPGMLAYLDADLRDPARILDHPQLRAALDLRRPVGLLLVAVLHFLPDDARPHDVVATLLDALAPDSYLVLSHATAEHYTTEARTALPELTAADPTGFHPRTRTDIAAFAPELDLVDPGLVSVAQWRAEHEPAPRPTAEDVGVYGLVARIPRSASHTVGTAAPATGAGR